jgi:flagellar motility protein MotE (MotC chaperone)
VKAAPRILPLVAVAIGGVLAIKLLTGVGALPQILSTAQAFAEGVGKPTPRMGPDGKPASATPADAAPAAVAAKPAAVCAPTAAELAKQAGLSPAELQVLQSLGTRRGQLDAREQGLETQIALMAAAETKVDAKIAALIAMKAEIAVLLGQVDAKQQAEVDRMVKVFEGMKPKDSAARFTLLSDEVRLPIAAKMKERALSAMLAQMSPPEAKRLTEALAARFAASQAVANGRAATAPAQTAAATPPLAKPSVAAPTRTADAATPVPEKPAAKPPAVRRAPKPNRTAQAPAKPAGDAAKPTTTAQAAPAPAKPASAPAAATPKPPETAKPTPAAPAAAKPG